MDELLANKWVIERELGGGGMGRVVKAHYASSDYPCAIKFLLPEHKHDAELVERFLNEAQVSNRIGHAGVCRIIDVDWVTDELPFLVMEYLEGESLEELLERSGGLLPIGEALRITGQILEVLCAAHEVGVLHRDIKPDNVYVTREGAIKILDFGVAKLPGAAITRVGATLGTLGYMSPESALGTTMSAGFKSDVWSTGVSLFRMLSAELPVDLGEHVSPLDALRAAATTPARKLSEVLPRCPATLEVLVGRMLAFDPEQRYSAAEALGALEELELSPDLVGQAGPWVWNPLVAARPRSARFNADRSSSSLRHIEVLDGRELEEIEDFEELHELDELDEADIEELHLRLVSNPRDHGACRELLRCYLDSGERDHARLLAASLRFCGEADTLARDLAEEGDARFVLPRGRLSRRQWREGLMAEHPSPQLSALLARLWPVLALSRQQAYAEAMPHPEQRLEVTRKAEGIGRWVAHVSAVLDLVPPQLFGVDDAGPELTLSVPTFAGVPQPVLLAGTDACAPQPAPALAFRCGHALARFHPYLIAGTILPSSSRLRDAIHGATLVCTEKVSLSTPHRDRAQTWQRLIEQLFDDEERAALTRAVQRVIRSGGDTKAWLRGCPATAVRVGLLMCGDLDVAGALVRDQGHGGAVTSELLDTLVAFGRARPYLELRRALTG